MRWWVGQEDDLLGPDNAPTHDTMDILHMILSCQWADFVEEFWRGYEWSNSTFAMYFFLLLNMVLLTRYTVRGMFWVYDRFFGTMSKPVVFAPFNRKSYWDREYLRDRGPFEWNADYWEIKPLLYRHINKNGELLYVGCGTSLLGEHLRDDGCRFVTCIDFSKAVIERQKEHFGSHPNLRFLVMNALALRFPPCSFDTVIDKGTMDSISCDLKEGEVRARQMLQEVLRVLRPGGVFVLVTTLQRNSALTLFGSLLRRCCSGVASPGPVQTQSHLVRNDDSVRVSGSTACTSVADHVCRDEGCHSRNGGCGKGHNGVEVVGGRSGVSKPQAEWFLLVEGVELCSRSELKVPRGAPNHALVFVKENLGRLVSSESVPGGACGGGEVDVEVGFIAEVRVSDDGSGENSGESSGEVESESDTSDRSSSGEEEDGEDSSSDYADSDDNEESSADDESAAVDDEDSDSSSSSSSSCGYSNRARALGRRDRVASSNVSSGSSSSDDDDEDIYGVGRRSSSNNTDGSEGGVDATTVGRRRVRLGSGDGGNDSGCGGQQQQQQQG